MRGQRHKLHQRTTDGQNLSPRYAIQSGVDVVREHGDGAVLYQGRCVPEVVATGVPRFVHLRLLSKDGPHPCTLFTRPSKKNPASPSKASQSASVSPIALGSRRMVRQKHECIDRMSPETEAASATATLRRLNEEDSAKELENRSTRTLGFLEVVHALENDGGGWGRVEYSNEDVEGIRANWG